MCYLTRKMFSPNLPVFWVTFGHFVTVPPVKKQNSKNMKLEFGRLPPPCFPRIYSVFFSF